MYIILLFISLFFMAASGIFVKLSEVGPVTTAVYRILLAIPLTFAWYKLEKSPPIRKIHFKEFALLQLAGIFFGADLILWHLSFHLTTLANANLLVNLIPFTVVPLSFLLYKEEIKKLFWASLVISIVGLVILVSGKAEIAEENLQGDFLAIMASLFYGFYFIIVHYLRSVRNYGTGYILFVSGFGSLSVLIPYALIFENNFFPKTIQGILIVVSIAVVSHIFGQGLLALSLKRIKASLGSVLLLSQPIIAAIYSYLIFKETLTPVEMIGILVVASGIYLAKKNT